MKLFNKTVLLLLIATTSHAFDNTDTALTGVAAGGYGAGYVLSQSVLPENQMPTLLQLHDLNAADLRPLPMITRASLEAEPMGWQVYNNIYNRFDLPGNGVLPRAFSYEINLSHYSMNRVTGNEIAETLAHFGENSNVTIRYITVSYKWEVYTTFAANFMYPTNHEFTGDLRAARIFLNNPPPHLVQMDLNVYPAININAKKITDAEISAKNEAISRVNAQRKDLLQRMQTENIEFVKANAEMTKIGAETAAANTLIRASNAKILMRARSLAILASAAVGMIVMRDKFGAEQASLCQDDVCKRLLEMQRQSAEAMLGKK